MIATPRRIVSASLFGKDKNAPNIMVMKAGVRGEVGWGGRGRGN